MPSDLDFDPQKGSDWTHWPTVLTHQTRKDKTISTSNKVIAHKSSSKVQFIRQNIASLEAIIAFKLIKVYRKTK